MSRILAGEGDESYRSSIDAPSRSGIDERRIDATRFLRSMNEGATLVV
jgi:hypothetical protein